MTKKSKVLEIKWQGKVKCLNINEKKSKGSLKSYFFLRDSS